MAVRPECDVDWLTGDVLADGVCRLDPGWYHRN